MEQRISLITPGVNDVAAARRFDETLGWKASASSRDIVAFFQVGCVGLALFSRIDLARDAGTPRAASHPGGIAIAYNARTRKEVDAVMAQASAAGGTVRKSATEASWGGYAGYFNDPDGHLWEVAWNSAFPLDAAGAITVS